MYAMYACMYVWVNVMVHGCMAVWMYECNVMYVCMYICNGMAWVNVCMYVMQCNVM